MVIHVKKTPFSPMRRLISFLFTVLALASIATAKNLTIERYTVSSTATSQEWILFSGDYFFHFTFPVEAIQAGQTYQLADMVDADSWGTRLGYFNMAAYTDASFCWTPGAAGAERIDAMAVVNGSTYNLTYVKEGLQPAIDTTHIVIPDAVAIDRTSTNHFCAFEGTADGYIVHLACIDATGAIVGEYDDLGMYNENGKLELNATRLWQFTGDSVRIPLVYANATVSSLPRGQYSVEAFLQDSLNHGYSISMTTVPRSGLQTIAIEAYELSIRDYSDGQIGRPQFSFQASNSQYGISIWVNSDVLMGEFFGSNIASCAIYGADGESDWSVTYDAGYMEVTTTEADTIVDGYALMSDGNTYTFHLTTAANEADALSNLPAQQAAEKFMRNGLLYIRKNNIIYGIKGEEY